MGYSFARITTRSGDHDLTCTVGTARRMLRDGILRSSDGIVTQHDRMDGGMIREHLYTVLARNVRKVERIIAEVERQAN